MAHHLVANEDRVHLESHRILPHVDHAIHCGEMILL